MCGSLFFLLNLGLWLCSLIPVSTEDGEPEPGSGGARTRHHTAFGGPMQQMTTLHDMSLTNNLLLNSAVSKACLLVAVKAASAGSGARRDLLKDLMEWRLMQRLG